MPTLRFSTSGADKVVSDIKKIDGATGTLNEDIKETGDSWDEVIKKSEAAQKSQEDAVDIDVEPAKTAIDDLKEAWSEVDAHLTETFDNWSNESFNMMGLLTDMAASIEKVGEEFEKADDKIRERAEKGEFDTVESLMATGLSRSMAEATLGRQHRTLGEVSGADREKQSEQFTEILRGAGGDFAARNYIAFRDAELDLPFGLGKGKWSDLAMLGQGERAFDFVESRTTAAAGVSGEDFRDRRMERLQEEQTTQQEKTNAILEDIKNTSNSSSGGGIPVGSG